MIITEENKLTNEKINKINDLYEVCNKTDGTKYCFDENSDFQRGHEINTFLYYSDDKIVSSLNIFAPTKKEAEIVALTLPSERKKGYFAELRKCLFKELEKREIKSILFVCDDRSIVGKTVIEHIGANYEFSEYLMKYNREYELQIENSNNIEIEIAKEKDLNKYIEINQKAFEDNEENATEILKEFFTGKNRELYGIVYRNDIIGMIGNYEEATRNYIYGFCIKPEFQRMGIGKYVLNEIANANRKKDFEKDIVLEVQTNNMKALNVYIHVGFEIVAEFKYYREHL